MSAFPSPTPATATADLRAFFDSLAAQYNEQHGSADALLTRRLHLLDRHAQFAASDVVLDVGCGPGIHLYALADRIQRGIGIDLAPRMIASAHRQAAHPALTFRVDNAEELETIPSSSIDKVICVGVLEHVLRPARALQQIARVLQPSGRFVALTLNGAYWWYRLADALGVPTRHLTSDRRFEPGRAERLLRRAGLRPDVGFWGFVPRGDLPVPLSLACNLLDILGQRTRLSALRGGLRLCGQPL